MISVELGDLTEADAEAILRPVAAEWEAVTPASRRVELAAGPEVAEACRRTGELPVGSAVLTMAGPMRARYLVHVAVRSPEEATNVAVVRTALRNGLRRLAEWGIDSVAIPALGTGAGNLDVEDAAEAMLAVLREHMSEAACPARVRILVESEYEREVFDRAARGAAASRAGRR